MCGSICACEAIRYDPRSPASAGKGVGTGKEVDSKAFPSGAFWLGATTTLSLFVASFWIFAIVVAINSKSVVAEEVEGGRNGTHVSRQQPFEVPPEKPPEGGPGACRGDAGQQQHSTEDPAWWQH